MLVTKSKSYHRHTPTYELFDEVKLPFPETPERIDAILTTCSKLGLKIEIIETAGESAVLVLHSRPYLDYLRKKCDELEQKKIAQIIPSEACGDTHSPLTPETYEVALGAANLAATSAKYLLEGKDDLLYALCRPPGHHAGYRAMQGSCYFNNAALASDILAKHGKVVVLDIDYHHGNGTQEFFYDRNDILFISIHAHPNQEYPFTTGFTDEEGVRQGKGYTLNIPLSRRSSERIYLQALRMAIKRLVDYRPQFIVLSLGYDTYKNDPLGGFDLDIKSYKTIGQMLCKARAKTPMLIIQEGGYAVDSLADMAENFIEGIEGFKPLKV